MAKYEFTNALLKEAIADAEAVRQTAIENAKLSLEETFTPQIKTMLSRRLRAEAEGTEYADAERTDKEEKSDEKAAHKKHVTDEAKEIPFQDATAEHDAKTPQDTSAIGATENKMPSDDADDTSDIGHGPEAHTDSHTDWYDDWSDSDFDLDEVIKELEEDVNSLSEMHHEEEEEEEEENDKGEEEGEEEHEEHHESPEGGMKKTADIEKKYAGEEDESVEMSPAANSHKYADASLKMDGKGHEEMGAEMGHDDHKGEEPHAPEAGEEELDLEAILRELEAEEQPDHMDGEEEHGKIASHMKNLETELAEYRKAVNLLRGKLQEVNLLNAKLLYTNRMFRKEGLTNEQKVTIVENFDRATNVREVKMVYTVLVETLTSAAKSLKAPKSSKKVVVEGLASKTVSSTAPKAEPVEIIAENTLAKRLQQLAGII